MHPHRRSRLLALAEQRPAAATTRRWILLNAMFSAAYEKADEVITAVGLEILSRGPEYAVLNDPERGACLMIKDEFAIAGPRDHPDSLLWWEPRFGVDVGPDVSEEKLWHSVRRNWLFDTLLAADRGRCAPDRLDRLREVSPR